MERVEGVLACLRDSDEPAAKLLLGYFETIGDSPSKLLGECEELLAWTLSMQFAADADVKREEDDD